MGDNALAGCVKLVGLAARQSVEIGGDGIAGSDSQQIWGAVGAAPRPRRDSALGRIPKPDGSDRLGSTSVDTVAQTCQ